MSIQRYEFGVREVIVEDIVQGFFNRRRVVGLNKIFLGGSIMREKMECYIELLVCLYLGGDGG